MADDPVEFADRTLQLLRDPALRRRLVTNARRLVETGKPIIFRTPVVPTVNDTPEEIGAIAAFVAELQALRGAGNGNGFTVEIHEL